VFKRRRRPSLTEESLARYLVFLELGGEKLQGDRTVQSQILGPVDLTHSAFADLLGDAIVADGGADHEAIHPQPAAASAAAVIQRLYPPRKS